MERARRKLQKAKDAGYETVAQRYAADRDLREVLMFNMGLRAGNHDSMKLYKAWLEEQDTLGLIPVNEKQLPPSLRAKKYEGTTVVKTQQGD